MEELYKIIQAIDLKGRIKFDIETGEPTSEFDVEITADYEKIYNAIKNNHLKKESHIFVMIINAFKKHVCKSCIDQSDKEECPHCFFNTGSFLGNKFDPKIKV